MNKPIEKVNSEIEIYFHLNGKNYSIKRIIEKGKGTTYSEIKEEGKIIESPNTSKVNDVVESILKINYELFSKVIYSEQNSLDYFLTIPRGQRMKKIDDILTIDKFEKARLNIMSVIKKISDKKNIKQIVIEKLNIEESKKTLETFKNIIINMSKEKEYLEVELNKQSQKKHLIEKEIGNSRKIKEELKNLEADEKKTLALIEEIHISIKEIEDSMKGENKIEIDKNLRELFRNLDEMSKLFKKESENYNKLLINYEKTKTEAEILKREKLDKLNAELERKIDINRFIDTKKLSPDKLEEKIEKKKKKIEIYEASMELIKIKIKNSKEIIDNINEIQNKCPLCNSKITKEKKLILINKNKFDIKKLEEVFIKDMGKNKISKDELKELQNQLEKLSEMVEFIKNIDDIKSELNNNKNIYAILKEQYQKFEKELNELKPKNELLEKNILENTERKIILEKIYSRMNEYELKKEKIQKLFTQKKQIEFNTSKLKESILGKDDIKLEINWKEIIENEKNIEAKIISMKQILSDKKSRINELEISLSKYDKELNDINKIDEIIKQLNIFEKSLEETQIQLRKEFITSINYTMNEIWPKLYSYKDFIGIRITIEKGDYILQLQERPNKWVNVEGFASGGERTISSLTLRISFALVLAPQLKWLILDEPTVNMDTKAVEDLGTTLSEHIGNLIDQTFLITHDEKLEKAVTGYAYKLTRDKINHGSTEILQIDK